MRPLDLVSWTIADTEKLWSTLSSGRNNPEFQFPDLMKIIRKTIKFQIFSFNVSTFFAGTI